MTTSDNIEVAKKLRRMMFGIPMMATEASHVEKEIAAFLAGEEDSLREELATWKSKAEKLEARVKELEEEMRKQIDDLSNDFLIVVSMLDRNTKPGYPMETDTGECYYCGQGLCEDEDGYQDDELMTPEHHKADCVWRQARELLDEKKVKAALARIEAEAKRGKLNGKA